MKTHIPGKQILDFTIETEDIAPEAVTDAQLNPTGIEGGSYTRVTVNEKGRVVEGKNPTTLAGYGIQDAVSYTDERFTISLLTSEDESALRSSSRQVTGTENQITTIDSGEGGKFKLGLADNVVLPGTGSITLTSGTTAQRPTAGNGKIRFNTDTNEVEASISGEWDAFVRERDLRLSVKNTLLVQKNPGPGQFGSVKEAIASITDAAVENRYVIRVTGGSYYEQNPIQMKRYVSVVGDNATSCIIHSLNPDSDLIVGVVDSSIQNISLADSYGPDASAIRFDNAEQNEVTRSFFAETIRFGRNARNVTVTSAGNYTGLYMSNCQFGGAQPYDVGFHVESTNGGVARLMMRSCTTRGSLPPYATKFGYVSGVGAEAVVMGSLFRTSATNTAQGIGYHLRDGGTLRTVGSTLRGFQTAVWIENAGVAPMLNAYNLGLESNTVDLKIDHPGARGVFQGTAAASKVFSVSNNVSIMYLDPAVQGVNIVGKLNLGSSQSLLTDVTDLIIETAPLGLLSGGVMSVSSGRTVVVSAGAGYLRKDGYVTRVSWPATSVTLDPGETAYLYVNKNGEILKALSMPDDYTSIHIGRAQAGSNIITTLGELSIDIKNHGNAIETYLREAAGPVFVSGSIVTENQDIPRAIDVSAGLFYYGTSATRPSAKTAPNLIDVHRTAGQVAATTIQQIPNDTVDNGTDLVPLSTGYFVKHTVYSVSEGDYQNFYLAHGQEEYATLEEAIIGPGPIPRLSADATPPIAYVIMQQGVNAISQILDIRPMFMRSIQGTTGGTIEHGDLLGLDRDDHTQYLLTDGSRVLAGDLDIGNNDIKNVHFINGISFSAHGSRHAPQGPDPIPTGQAISLTTSSSNTTGVSNTLARSDHTHQLVGVQPLSGELTSLSAISTTGIVIHSGANTWVTRTVNGAGGRINVTNGSGIDGNPTIDLASVGISGTYAGVTTDAFGRVTSGTTTLDWSKLSNTPTTISGYGITDAQFKDDLLTTLADMNGNGIFVITSDSTAAARSIIGPANGVIVTNGSGVAGNPTISLGNDLAAVEGLTSTGFAVRSGNDTWTTRTITAPNDGLVITNGSGIAGNVTIGLEKDLSAIEGLTATGFAVRTAADTWATRTLTGTAGNIVITAGSGTSGDPSINLATAGTAGTYSLITTDTFGRVISGSKPTTLSGYGITDAVQSSQVGANNGIATLGSDGKLTSSQLPALAITDTFVVASQTGMLTITGAEVGDIAVRTDLNKSFILRAPGANVLANWQELLTPTDTVLSVNGQTGTVSINTGVMSVSATAPTAGLTISGAPITSTGTLAFALANDLAAVEGLTGTGIAVRTAADTWTTRAIAVGNSLSITNGDGISGNPTISLPSIGTAGTFKSVTTDAFGRVTAGTNPTTLAGYGITDALTSSSATPNNTANTIVQRDSSGGFVAGTITASLAGNASTATKLATARTINGYAFDGTSNIALTAADIGHGNVVNSLQVINAGTLPRMSSGTLANRPAASTAGAMYIALDNATWYRDNGSSWDAMIPAFTGDVISPVGSPSITLPTVVSEGTYDRVTVNAKGLVTAGTVAGSRSNQMFSGSIATQTGTSTIILSTTGVPTSTQGTLIATQSITPATTSARVVIDFCGIVDTNFNGGVFVTVFRGTTFLGMAITATQEAAGSSTVSTPETFSLKIVDAPGTTTAQTYTIRIGGNAAGTWWLGRTEGLSIGGVNKSYWTMTEFI